ncbi:HK97 gp10 family phage protein [Mesorhizobium sp. RP14(2022)]|uniref:HK97 gp10 family phage protein n=1 Tax=Mesorhizobium liriopis TaxID=2953882 RepID=A0ABT1C7Q8_9HYPH|nr:HK97 gp10 family phage protein [Mesorhizobium liriopis]MCO6050844.1 HK97 gp10 family phage protein [Mesorhizobium liriopis]
MANLSFAAQVVDWVRKVEGATEAVFKESAQELVSQMQALVPVDTGFLRASLVASTSAMPALTLNNPGGTFNADVGQIELVIAGSELGDTIYLGYTAKYGVYVHYGANGRSPRPWVDMVAQRWGTIVNEKAAELKSRLGL